MTRWRSTLRWLRSDGLVAQTRRVFFLLVVVSLVLVLPRPMSATGTTLLPALVVAYVALLAIWVVRLAAGRAHLVLDVLEAVLIGVAGAAYLDAAMVYTFAFAALWYRGLFGSTPRVLLHCGLVATTLAVVMSMTSHLPVVGAVFATAPVMLLTVGVSRYLALSLFAREQAQRRDAALVRLGNGLIGVSDYVTILDLVRECAASITTATPGLRLLAARDRGDHLEVTSRFGAVEEIPTTLPAGVLPVDRALRDAPAAVALPGAADVRWLALPVPDRPDTWAFAGSPAGVPDEAIVAIHSMINQFALALQSSAAHQDLATQATTDPLTGLANRAAFGAALQAGLADPVHPVALLLLDLDDFKTVNDGLGHSAGDDLLCHVAQRLRSAVREHDVCARLGGDEFAVLLTEPERDAVAVAQRLVDLVATPVPLRQGLSQVGASIGVAFGTAGRPPDELMQHADIAMYAAKAKGKNRVQVFDPTLLREDAGAAFESELARAATSQLVVHYQPILAVPDGRCVAVEALARWQHPTRGLLLPAEFIEAAERTGAIVAIGAAVLRRACRDVSGWRAHHGRLAVHVNVSSVQLSDPGFVDTVRACVRDYELEPRQLVLEIVETMVIDSPVVRDALRALTGIGAAIAIDDFGTGYSALSTLRTLPLDIVKIDKSFLDDGASPQADAAVVEAIVQVANRLGLSVIAEGVERSDQQAFLAEAGVGAAQGYLHQRPVAAEDLLAWLDRRSPGEGATVTQLPSRRLG